MLKYFQMTDIDRTFFNEWIAPRLPERLFDMHLHITRGCDAADVSQEMIDRDWAMQCGFLMDETDLAEYCRILWQGRRVEVNAFPMPIRGIDLKSANLHLESLLKQRTPDKAMTVRTAELAISPSFDPDECEEQMLRGGFLGYKPYPDLVSGQKGADIRIFDFLPDAFLRSLDRNRRAVTIHLPRAERLASPANIRELLEIRQKYPDIRVIIAHCGRSYNIEVIEKAYEQMKADIGGFYFDTAAVINPAVHRFLLERVPQDRFFYGTDMPLLLWHGKRTWENGTYRNHAREAFRWNAASGESPEEKAKYTFFLYEQVKAILDVAYEIGGKELAEKIFHANAENFVKDVLPENKI